MLELFIFFMEILFCYIILLQFNIKDIKNKILLFIIILFTLLTGDIFLSSSIFKHLYYVIAFLIGLRILNKDTKLVYSVTITLIIFCKYIIEFLTVFMLLNKVNFNFIVIIFGILSVIFSIFTSKYIKNINAKFIKLWDKNNCFSFRYLCLISLNLFVIFILYNLMLIKEVL